MRGNEDLTIDNKLIIRYFLHFLVYHCGSEAGWSDLFWFKTYPSFSGAAESWAPTIAVYGDLGNENAQSLPRLQV